MAHAQLHSDLSVQAGGEKRFLSSRAPGVDDAGPGGRAEIRGHLAFFPFIHLGGYGAYALAPQSGNLRHVGSLGIHARIGAPLPGTERFSVWFDFGTGYARGVSGDAGGGFIEVPVGLGVGYKLRKPFVLFGELGSAFGLGHHGALYAERGAGRDAVALSLSVGLRIEL